MMKSKFSVVSNKGLHIYSLDGSNFKELFHDSSAIHESLYDPSGRYFAYCTNNGAYLLNLCDNKPIPLSNSTKFRRIQFSPRGSFVTFFSVIINGQEVEDNVVVFKTSDNSKVCSYKHGMTGLWSYQWSDDESIAIRVSKSEVLLYTDGNLEQYSSKLNAKGLEKAALAQKGNEYYIAAYIKGNASMPHMMKLFHYKNLKNSINNRSFFKANDIEMHWHPKGKSLLFMAHSESSKNYYGEDTLYYMNCEPNGETAVVTMPKDSELVQGVVWKKGSGDKFLVMYNNPVKIGVFNDKCQFLYDMDSKNRNSCNFSHCGNLLALAGVGNVNESIQIWDFPNKKVVAEFSLQDINRVRWSGNDKYLAAATVSPSLRVNNGFMIFNVSEGEVVIDKSTSVSLVGGATEIYSIEMAPESSSDIHTKEQICQTFKSNYYYFDKDLQKHTEQKTMKSTQPTAYVPPHLRNRAGATSVTNSRAITGGNSTPKGDKETTFMKNGSMIKITSDSNSQGVKKKKNRNKNKKQNQDSVTSG